MNDFSTDTESSEITSFALDYAIVSDIGKRRTENQDSFARTRSAKSHLFIVADGMGGARGGATASALAVNIIGRKAFSSDGVVTAESLKKSLELANHVVHAFGTRDEELAGMGTTVVALAITGDEMVIGFVGDSRIYFFRDNQIIQLSRDHTLVQELVDSGALAEDEATNHPISHMLTRSLGPMFTVNVETSQLSKKVVPGDTILLCCDGLYNLVTDEEIKNILSKFHPQEAAEKLVDLANERGGADNITVEVVRVLPEERQIEDSDAQEGILEEQYSKTGIDLKIQVDFDRIDATLARILQEPQIAVPISDDLDEFPDLNENDHSGETADDNVKEEVSSETQEESSFPKDDEQTENLGHEVGVEFVLPKEGDRSEFQEVPSDENSSVDNKIEELSGDQTSKKLRKIVLLGTLFAALVLVVGVLVFVIRASIDSLPRPKSDIRKSLESAQFDNVGPAEVATKGQGPASDKEDQKGVVQSRENASYQAEPRKVQIQYVSPESLIPEDLKINNEELRKISDLVANSSDFFIPEPPPVEIVSVEIPAKDSQSQDMQPIYWDAEREKIDALQSQSVATNAAVSVDWNNEEKNINEGLPSPEEERAMNVLQPEELGNDEKQQIAARKQALRDKVSDLDAKLKVFSFRDLDESNNAKTQLEGTLQDVNDALEYKAIEKDFVERNLKEFQDYKKQIKEKGFEGFPMLPKVVEQSRELIVAFEAYSASSSEYQQSLETWKKKPNDSSLSAKMVAKGNEIRVTHNKLQNALDEFIDSQLNSKKENYYNLLQQVRDLERRRDRINRQIGFIMAYSPNLVPSRRMVLQRELLDNRRLLEKEYKVLSEQLPDNEEKSISAEALRLNNVIPE